MAHRRWKDKNLRPILPSYTHGARSTSSWLKIGFGILVLLGCLKFLLFTEPMALEDLTPFRNSTMVQISTDYGIYLSIQRSFHSIGDIVIELFPEAAPLTVKHFLELVDRGFYDKSTTGFYRSEPQFVLQGGGFIHDHLDDAKLPVEYK